MVREKGGRCQSVGQDVKYYFADGRRIAMRKNGTLYYLTQDHLGSTALATNAAGGMVARNRYYPQGGVRTEEPQEGAMPTDKLFTGQQRESDDVYDYGARMYNTSLGRMPQADPLVPDPFNPQSYNAYSYVINNPVNYVDPCGAFFVSPPFGGSGGDWQLGGMNLSGIKPNPPAAAPPQPGPLPPLPTPTPTTTPTPVPPDEYEQCFTRCVCAFEDDPARCKRDLSRYCISSCATCVVNPLGCIRCAGCGGRALGCVVACAILA
jgi:RHS repeat-associated protein